MNKFEQNPNNNEINNQEESPYCKRVEEISFEAADMPEFQTEVENAKNIFDAIVKVRELLKKYFPEIKNLPDPQNFSEDSLAMKGKRGHIFGNPASNDFKIARNIVDLLFEKK